MTDLDQLKQELYKKIKETEQPDPVPTRKDLLKYSQLRPNQPDDHWKESIAQARIPASSSNEALSQVAEYLQMKGTNTIMQDRQIVSSNQTTAKNSAWVNVTVTLTYDSGETKQISSIQPKVKG